MVVTNSEKQARPAVDELLSAPTVTISLSDFMNDARKSECLARLRAYIDAMEKL